MSLILKAADIFTLAELSSLNASKDTPVSIIVTALSEGNSTVVYSGKFTSFVKSNIVDATVRYSVVFA